MATTPEQVTVAARLRDVVWDLVCVSNGLHFHPLLLNHLCREAYPSVGVGKACP